MCFTACIIIIISDTRLDMAFFLGRASGSRNVFPFHDLKMGNRKTYGTEFSFVGFEPACDGFQFTNPPHPHNIWDKKKMALVMWGGFNLQLASIFLACPFCLKDLRASRCVTIDTSRTELTQSGTAPH